jgi:NTE family protein
MVFLDSTIINVAFPSIQSSFPHASISTLSWVLNGYNIALGAFLVALGRIADLLGRRRLFLLGVVVFTASSAACALATGPGFLIFFRIAQGFGGAALVPASLALVIEAFPGHETHAVTLWGAAAALAAGLGPPIGGALVASSSWRLAFLVNLPIGVLAFAVGRRGLVESRSPGRRLIPDIRGALLLAAGISLVTFAIIEGSDWGWSSARVVGLLLASLVLLVSFTLSNRSHPAPVLDPALLRLRRFKVANVLTVVAGAGFYMYTLDHILWLHYVWHYSVFLAGLSVAPGALVAALVARPFGSLAERYGHTFVIFSGALIWAAALGYFYAHRIGLAPDFLGQWLPAQIVSGLGVAAVLPLLASAAVTGVPGRRYATASAAVSGSRQLGGVIGITLFVVIVNSHPAFDVIHSLREAWYFCALCFAVVAAGALFLGSAHSPNGVSADEEVDVPAELFVPATSGLSHSNGSMNREGEASIFATLPAEMLDTLRSGLTSIDLRAGEWLFRTGDSGDAMYFVERGQLDVVIDDRRVSRLSRGDVVGELALLTGERRNASVRARRESTLLRLDGEQFESLAARDQQVPLAVARTLARRLQRVVAPTLGLGPARVVAVVGADQHAPAAALSAALVQALSTHERVVDPGRVEADGLERAEEAFDRVVLTADDGDRTWRDFCIRVADRVVIVTDGSAAPLLRIPGGMSEVDLAITGGPHPRSLMTEWCDAYSPVSIHRVDAGNLPESVTPLVKRLLRRSLGLVLSGGGARGLCHIGVIEALEEAHISIDRIAGTSAGAIVGGLYACGYDATAVDAIMYEEFVRNNPYNDYTFPTHGLTRGQKTRGALVRRFGDLFIEDLPREFRCVSVDLSSRARIVHSRGPMVDAVMASLRLPGLFSPYRIQGTLHVDGGVMDNIPVGVLADRPEGPIVAVAINLGGSTTGDGEPELPGIRETLIRSMLISSHQAADEALRRADVVIHPNVDGVGLLEWHQIDILREAGREAARAALPEITRMLG